VLDEGGPGYTDMRLWVAASLGNLNMPIERALAAGLRYREKFRDMRPRRSRSMAPSPRSTRAVASVVPWH
jgi:hypothetical protein